MNQFCIKQIEYVDLWNRHHDKKIILDLQWANLADAYLTWANLTDANLTGANLPGANLPGADMSGANMSGANLIGANMTWANLTRANLTGSDMSGANLTRANLTGSDMSGANLNEANLSEAKGIIITSEWLEQNFKITDEGYIVYRVKIGFYNHPDHWVFEPGRELTETPNPNRTTECGCGISFATLDYLRSYHAGGEWWECLIRWRWAADIIVPINGGGKARCAKLELVRIVDKNSL